MGEVQDAAKAMGVSRQDCTAIIETFLEMMTTALCEEGEAKIPLFGRFYCKESQPVMRSNPRTGEKLWVDAKRKVLFSPSVTLKNRLNGVEDEEEISED